MHIYKGLRVAITTIDEVFRNEIRTQLKTDGFQECDIFEASHDNAKNMSFMDQ